MSLNCKDKECDNLVHKEISCCMSCAEKEKNPKGSYKDTISALKAEIKNCKRTIRIYEGVFEELGKTIPVEQCDRCGEILYCDTNVWVSGDDTQILCTTCMEEEVDNREGDKCI